MFAPALVSPVRVERLVAGNPGDVRPVGEGVSKPRIDYGPGYRVNFKIQGRTLVVLLAGGGKRTQSRDVETVQRLAQDLQAKTMTKNVTSRFGVAEHLRTPEEMAAYLEASIEEPDGDTAFIAKVLGVIARQGHVTGRMRCRAVPREFVHFRGGCKPTLDRFPRWSAL